MKLASLMHNVGADFEDRKRALQRKEMGQAYKNNAKFVDASKNSLLQALENLLSGKTEKDLHAVDNAAKKEDEQQSVVEKKQQYLEKPEVKKEIEQLKQIEKNVIVHEQAHKAAGAGTGAVSYSHTTGPDDQRYIVAGEVDAPSGNTPEDTIAILEKVRQAALAPADPSPQDLRVAASAVAHIQQSKAELLGEKAEEFMQDDTEPYATENLHVDIPQRFQNDVARDSKEETVFGKELESLLFMRTFNKAAVHYNNHIAMVKNGYRMVEEPKFSQTA